MPIRALREVNKYTPVCMQNPLQLYKTLLQMSPLRNIEELSTTYEHSHGLMTCHKTPAKIKTLKNTIFSNKLVDLLKPKNLPISSYPRSGPNN